MNKRVILAGAVLVLVTAVLGIAARRPVVSDSGRGGRSAGPGKPEGAVTANLVVISGRVIDESGRPLGKARVVGTRKDNRTEIELDRNTDELGRFKFEVPAVAQRWFLWAFVDGCAPSTVRFVDVDPIADPRMVTFVVVAGAELSGTVVDASDRPIAGAVVSVMPSTDGAPMPYGEDRFARTGKDGTFQLRGLRSGSIRVACASPGYADREQRLELRSGEPGRIDFRMVKGGVLAGRVLANGRPVDHFKVVLVPDGGSLQKLVRTFADPDGRFAIDKLVPGRFAVRVFAPMVIQHSILNAEVRMDEAAEVAIEMTPVPGFSFKVVKEGTGIPLARARLRFEPDRNRPDYELVKEQIDLLDVVSDIEGRGIAAIPPGAYRSTVSLPGFANRELDVILGETASGPVTIALRPALIADLSLWSPGMQLTVKNGAGETVFRDGVADGHASVSLASSGEHTLIVTEETSNRYVEHRFTLSLRAGAFVNVDPPDFGHAQFCVSGRVTSGGQPLEDAKVHLSQSRHGISSDYIVRTVKGGAFQLRGVSSGSASLSVKTGDAMLVRDEPEHCESIAVDRDLELEIALSGATIAVSLDGPEGPAEGAVVLVFRRGVSGPKLIASAIAPSTGEVRILHLKEGQYSLEIGGPSFAPQRVDEFALGASGVVSMDRQVRRGADLRGIISDQEGKGVAGVAVRLMDTAIGWVYETKHAISDADGGFSIPHVSSGNWTLSLSTSSVVRQSSPFTTPRQDPDGIMRLQW